MVAGGKLLWVYLQELCQLLTVNTGEKNPFLLSAGEGGEVIILKCVGEFCYFWFVCFGSDLILGLKPGRQVIYHCCMPAQQPILNKACPQEKPFLNQNFTYLKVGNNHLQLLQLPCPTGETKKH